MKYCQRCKLYLHTSGDHCPLCFETVGERVVDPATAPSFLSQEGNNDSQRYPSGDEASVIRYDLVLRLLLFLSIVAVSVCTLINILLYNGFLWCLIVVGTIVYLWIAVAYPIFRKKNIGQIIVLETFTSSLVLYIIQVLTGTNGWALEYAMPFLFSGATLLITFILLLRRMKWRQFTVYQMSTMLLGFIPALFCAVGLVKIVWPSLFSALYSFLTLVGMFVFADKKYKNEIIKRFHF